MEDSAKEFGWVAAELSPVGERRENLPKLKGEVHRHLGNGVEVFIPSYFWMDHGQSHVVPFLEGYVFIKASSSLAGLSEEARGVVEFLRGKGGQHGRSSIVRSCGVSDLQWNVVMDEALSSGRVRRVGRKRGTKYEYSDSPPTLNSVFKIEKSYMFSRVLSYRVGNRRLPEVIPNEDILRLREMGADFIRERVSEGDRVLVTDGIYRNMIGIAVHKSDVEITVQFRLRSIEILAPIPFFITETIEE